MPRGRPKGFSRHRSTLILERRQRVVHLRITEGLTVPQIAEREKCSTTTVDHDLKACVNLWRERIKDTVDHWVAKELAEFAAIRREMWAEWLRSKKGKQVVTVEKEPGTDKPTKITVKTEPQCGDPSYITKIQECIKQERELLGLDKPAKLELTGRNGGPMELDVNAYTDEQLLRIVEGDMVRALAVEHQRQQLQGDGQEPKVITVDVESVGEPSGPGEQGRQSVEKADTEDVEESDSFDDLF